jgi:DnaJ like chaperone protein
MTIWERIGDAYEGSTVQGLFQRLAGLFEGERAGGVSAPHHQVAFTIAVIALGAKMAKADGHVHKIEVDAFKEVFKSAESEAGNVGRVFDLARQDVAGYEAYADQLGSLFQDDRRLLQDVLEGLFHIATADGLLLPGEDAYLRDVARRFGIQESQYRFIRARFVKSEERDPYDALKITPDASNEAIKAQYRKLAAANHPDTFIARGMPKDAIDIANRKLAAINEAYELIARERGIK